MKHKYKTFVFNRTLALLPAFVIGFTLNPLWNGGLNSYAGAASVKELDYIGDKYGLSDHVFDVLNFDL